MHYSKSIKVLKNWGGAAIRCDKNQQIHPKKLIDKTETKICIRISIEKKVFRNFNRVVLETASFQKIIVFFCFSVPLSRGSKNSIIG